MNMTVDGELARVPVDDYLKDHRNGIKYPAFYMYLEQEPYLSDLEHQFKLIYILKDGDVVETVTDEVILSY